MPKAFFDHSRFEHTFQTNAVYSISGFPHIPRTGSQWRKIVPERRVTLLAEKDVDPEQKTLARALTVSHWRREVTWASQIVLSEKSRPGWEGDPASRVPLPAEPTFCFSWKQFAKFCKEMLVEKFGFPAVARIGGWALYPSTCDPGLLSTGSLSNNDGDGYENVS